MAYEDELEKNGSKIIHTIPKRENLNQYFREMKNFFKSNGSEYDCLWFNVNNLVNIDCVKLAKKYNISKIIIHSHNSRIMEQGLKGALKKQIHYHNRHKIEHYATDYWACSKVAAEWLFPSKLNADIKIIKNEFTIRINQKMNITIDINWVANFYVNNNNTIIKLEFDNLGDVVLAIK